MTWLTYRQAAKRVKRSTRTIKRWRRNGMPMSHNEHGQRIVNENTLLAWWRQRLNNDPVHQQRLQKALRNEQEHAHG